MAETAAPKDDDPLDPDAFVETLPSLLAPTPPGVIAGVNDDDCAVIDWGSEILVATTDFLNARPIALELGIGTYSDLGRLVVLSSISDLCGSGALPKSLLIGAMLPRGTATSDFTAFMTGAAAEAKRWGVPIVGGDTKLGASLSVYSVGLGSAKSKEELFLKNAARPGDSLWISGPVGSCSAAAIGLSQKCMPSGWNRWATERVLRPSAPLDKSRSVAEARMGRGGIDISDGLGDDLHRLCLASNVGVILEAASIPVEPQVVELASVLAAEPWAFSFGSGGDLQFLVTTAATCHEHLISTGFTKVGILTEAKDLLFRMKDGSVRRLPKGGHRDARNESFAQEALRLSMEATNGSTD